MRIFTGTAVCSAAALGILLAPTATTPASADPAPPGKDGEGKRIPTREGNGKFGWRHFTDRHNIHGPKVVRIVTSERPEEKKGTRRVYGGVLVNRSGIVLARIKVIAQYAHKTADGAYRLADDSHKIGTITAYCERVPRNKCPNAVNET